MDSRTSVGTPSAPRCAHQEQQERASRDGHQRAGGREKADGELVLGDIVSAAVEKESDANTPANLDDHSLVGERAVGQAAGELAHGSVRRQAFGCDNPLEEVYAEILLSLALGKPQHGMLNGPRWLVVETLDLVPHLDRVEGLVVAVAMRE
jgi:hypothetical protein